MRHATRIDIDANNVVTNVSKTCPGDETHVSRTENRDPHGLYGFLAIPRIRVAVELTASPEKGTSELLVQQLQELDGPLLHDVLVTTGFHVQANKRFRIGCTEIETPIIEFH